MINAIIFAYLLPPLFGRYFAIKVARVVNDFQFMENAATWEHIHF